MKYAHFNLYTVNNLFHCSVNLFGLVPQGIADFATKHPVVWTVECAKGFTGVAAFWDWLIEQGFTPYAQGPDEKRIFG